MRQTSHDQEEKRAQMPSEKPRSNLARPQALILSEGKGGFYLILTVGNYRLPNVRKG